MADTQIKFPVLAISRDTSLVAMRTRDELEIGNTYSLKKGYWTGLFLIEASGQTWEVKEARSIAYFTPWRPWHILTGRQIRVELDVVKGARLELAEAQERVCRAIDEFAERCDVISEPDKMKARVRKMPSISKIVGIFIAFYR